MSAQRTTFLKRQREQNKKDKARSKQERLAARRASAPGEKGPPIAWDEQVQQVDSTDDNAPVTDATDGSTDQAGDTPSE